KMDISIAFVGRAEIKRLNKKYRKKDYFTDVLSYIYSRNLGEVVICPQVVDKNAKIFNNSFKKELVRILTHGILHLFGYDHEKSKKEAEKMIKKEEKYIN
ncbi:rRNA maturation RNase YbeY, partial [Patescibacteria group bacterium]